MWIHSVELYNFMLFKRLKKLFGDKDIIGVICEYLDSPDRSNQGGKSTLVEAIRWCLTGLSRADTDKDLIHYGEDHCWVKVVLVDEQGKKISVKRGIGKKKGDSILEVLGSDKKRESQAIIDEILGFDKEEFDLTLFFKQMDINKFMELKPTELKKHLMQWLQKTHWVKLERAVLDDLNALNKKIDSMKSRLKTLQSEIADEDEVKVEIRKLQKERKKLKTQLVGVREKLERVQYKIQQEKKMRSELKARQDELLEKESELEEQLEDLEFDGEDLKEAKSELSSAKKEESRHAMKPEMKDKLSRKIGQVETHIRETKKVFKELEKQGGVCPLLNESCDRIDTSRKDIKKWKHDVKELGVELNRLRAEHGEAVAAEKAQKQLDRALRHVEKVQGAMKERKRISADLKAVRADLEKLSNTRFKLDSAEVDQLKGQVEDKEGGLTELDRRLGAQKGILSRNEILFQKTEKLDRRVKVLQRKAVKLKYLAMMFGKNGIPSQEIENAFDEVEDEMNFTLERLGTSLQIEFKPDRELGTWEDFCSCGWEFPKGTRKKECDECGAPRRRKRKDEPQFRVLDGGRDIGFKMESGGGKTLVSMSARIALTRLKQRQSDSKFSVLFLDEPDAALDPVNRSAFMRLLTETLIHEFGFKQVFWISHFKEVQESLPNVLKIVRHKTYSKAVWV